MTSRMHTTVRAFAAAGLASLAIAAPAAAADTTEYNGVEVDATAHPRAALRAARGKATVKPVLKDRRGGKPLTRTLATARR